MGIFNCCKNCLSREETERAQPETNLRSSQRNSNTHSLPVSRESQVRLGSRNLPSRRNDNLANNEGNQNDILHDPPSMPYPNSYSNMIPPSKPSTTEHDNTAYHIDSHFSPFAPFEPAGGQYYKTDINLTNEQKAAVMKEDGNKAFRIGSYSKAIEFYSAAIALDPSVSIFYSNRGRCYKKMKKWEEAKSDCQEAISRDSSNVKAFVLDGECSLNLGRENNQISEIENGIKQLLRARQIANDLKQDSFLPYLNSEITKAEKIKMQKESVNQEQEIYNLQSELQQIMEKDNSIPEVEKSKYKNILSGIFREKESELKEHNKQTAQAPQFMDLMERPYITPSGVTYEREAILNHLELVGKFDPISREKLNKKQLIENKALKMATQTYRANNPWVMDDIFNIDENRDF